MSLTQITPLFPQSQCQPFVVKEDDDFDSFSSLYNSSLPVGMSTSLYTYPYPAYGGEKAFADEQTSPAEWKDTPRTLYKGSPETEAGDSDILSDLDGEGEDDPEMSDKRAPLFGTSPHDECQSDENNSTNSAFQSLARRLPADILTASSLFPEVSIGLPLPHQTRSSQQMQTNGGLPARADVIPPPSIPRKRSMHLSAPNQPINPYQRPAGVQNAPPAQFPAVSIDRSCLRRFHNTAPPQPTVSMRQLLMPHAEFRFGYDPEVLALEIKSPPLHDFESIAEVVQDYAAEAPLFSAAELEPSPVVQDNTAFPEEVEEHDTQDVTETAGDSTWTPDDADEASYEPPAKRRKTRATSESEPAREATPARQAPSRTRRAGHEVTKTRKRHLQPNLVRTNGCMYGCPLLFSTAYEARRHQEDTHGREEAYAFIEAANAAPRISIPAKDYRFLLQIAVHTMGDKLDSRARAKLDQAVEQDDAELEAEVVDTIAKFARDWTKRYECPRCGASFSRLDSKKRHFEKQCR